LKPFHFREPFFREISLVSVKREQNNLTNYQSDQNHQKPVRSQRNDENKTIFPVYRAGVAGWRSFCAGATGIGNCADE
jgi:hypothetical protein